VGVGAGVRGERGAAGGEKRGMKKRGGRKGEERGKREEGERKE